jgi:hypothetical protein
MVAGVVAVALVAGMGESPLSPALPPGAGPYAPLSTVVRALGLDALTEGGRVAASIVAVVLFTAAFLFAAWAAWRGALSARLVAGLGVAFVVAMTALPLLLSRDVYSYAIYGRIASLYHANPYVAVPADFARDSIYSVVGPEWRHTPAVYGPAFTLLSSGITRVLRGPAADVWAFKALAGAAGIALVLLVKEAAHRLWPSRAPFALALVAWNPVFLLDAVGTGHNDVLVGCAVAGALAVLAGPSSSQPRGPSLRRDMLASGVLTLGALVKAPAAIPLALLVVGSAWRRHGRDRIRALAAHVTVVLGLVVLFGAPFFQWHDPTLGLATLATHLGWLAPTRLFRVLLGDAARSVGGAGAGTAVETAVRVAFAGAFLVVFVLLLRRAARVGVRWSRDLDPQSAPMNGAGTWPSAQAGLWAWGLLLFTLLSPVLLPWYAVWTVPIAWLMPGEGVVGAVALSAVLALSQTIAEPMSLRNPAVFDGMVLTGHYVLTPALCALLGWLGVSFLRRVRRGTPLDAVPVSAGAADHVRPGVSADGDDGAHGEGRRAGERRPQPVDGHPAEQQGGGAEGWSDGHGGDGLGRGRQSPSQPHQPQEDR